MERLAATEGFAIQQRKEWGEALTGFEVSNRYVVSDVSGSAVYDAMELRGLFLARNFLKSLRPFTVRVLGDDSRALVEIQRPFRFFFHEVTVSADGRTLGSIRRQFSVFQRLYSVCNPAGRETMRIVGPLLHPWTFNIERGPRTIGQIKKQWSGLMTEMVTDADNFGVTFPAELDPSQKCLLLGAVFLIDFVHFEDTNRRG
ncbi:MAG: scramblase [Chitinivibrionales bacterium]|nr:scramblase [Chitinivibrionales bacterium]